MDSRLIIIALVAYLLGSIPFGYILVKLFLKQDIRATGSGNIGATNVARSGNKGLAIATLLLDAGKGAMAVIIAARLEAALPRKGFLPDAVTPDSIHQHLYLPMALAASMAIIGHCFPVWLKFRGGKGVATAIGAFALLSPKAALGAFATFVIIFAVSRYVSLASVLSAAAFPFLVQWLEPRYRTAILLTLCALSSLIIILKHHANIRRLIAGTEPKFGKKAIGWNDPAVTEKNL